MDRMEILARVKKVIGAVLKIDPAGISDESNFVFDLGADSMQSMQLVGAFEEEFGVEMEEDKALGVQDVTGAVNFIAEYV